MAKSLSERMEEIEPRVLPKIQNDFLEKKKSFPPEKIWLLGFKEEKVLEVWIRQSQETIKLWEYPILAASGTKGPKLREGDRQVPEGFYTLEYLNPNSRFHLSMKINYPNTEDRKIAEKEGRLNPGSDIFIHGEDVSIGCLAIGNQNIEELFYLVEKTGIEKVEVWISPYDFRKKGIREEDLNQFWVTERYKLLHSNLEKLNSW